MGSPTRGTTPPAQPEIRRACSSARRRPRLRTPRQRSVWLLRARSLPVALPRRRRRHHSPRTHTSETQRICRTPHRRTTPRPAHRNMDPHPPRCAHPRFSAITCNRAGSATNSTRRTLVADRANPRCESRNGQGCTACRLHPSTPRTTGGRHSRQRPSANQSTVAVSGARSVPFNCRFAERNRTAVAPPANGSQLRPHARRAVSADRGR